MHKPKTTEPNQSLQTISCSVTVAAEPLCVPPHEMSDLKRSAKNKTSMSSIISYKEGEFSTISLDSGEKIMISRINHTYFIRQMKFMGILPGKLVAQWSIPEALSYGDEAMQSIGIKSSFRMTVDDYLKYRSIDQIRAAFIDAGNRSLLH